MRVLAIVAAGLGFVSSAVALPEPECKTPAIYTVTVKLSPVRVIYKEVSSSRVGVPCGPGCKLQIKTVTETHPHWKGRVTATATHKLQITPVPACDVVVDVPEPGDKDKEDEKAQD